MHPPPLLLERPFALQVVLAVVVPALLGLLTGFVLGVSEVGYLALSLLAILGGLAGGYEHDGASEALARGLCGGLLFGVFILVGHSVFGQQAKAQLPEPHALLVAITTVLGLALHAVGGALRERRGPRARTTA